MQVPQNIDQPVVSIRLVDCSRTLPTTMLPAALAIEATMPSARPSRKWPLPPWLISCSAPAIECQNSRVTPAIAADARAQVRRGIGVPKAMRAQIGVQNTISANSTATRADTTYCSAL